LRARQQRPHTHVHTHTRTHAQRNTRKCTHTHTHRHTPALRSAGPCTHSPQCGCCCDKWGPVHDLQICDSQSHSHLRSKRAMLCVCVRVCVCVWMKGSRTLGPSGQSRLAGGQVSTIRCKFHDCYFQLTQKERKSTFAYAVL